MTTKPYTLTLTVAAVAAAINFSAKNDIRSYLNSIHVTARGESLLVVATDGHALLGALDMSSHYTGLEQPTVTIPRDAIDWALKNTKKGQKILVHVDGRKAEVVAGNGTTMVIALVDNHYPDFMAVTPNVNPLSGEEAYFSAKLMAKITKAGTDLDRYGGCDNKHGTFVKIVGNGDRNATVFRFCNLIDGLTVGGVIMAVRADDGFTRDNIAKMF